MGRKNEHDHRTDRADLEKINIKSDSHRALERSPGVSQALCRTWNARREDLIVRTRHNDEVALS